MQEVTVILLAAGSGTRVGLLYNKVLEKVNDKYIYEYSLDTFLSFNLPVILVVSEVDYDFFVKNNTRNVTIIKGGKTRNESVMNALNCVKTKRVLIHDAARALVTPDIIESCLNSKSEAYYVYVPLKDTIRDKNNKTLRRENLVNVQTPQGGETGLFKKYEKYSTTDDISSFDNEAVQIERILGNDYNFKITTKFDMVMFKNIMRYNDDKNR